jgi:hypothetical protein
VKEGQAFLQSGFSETIAFLDVQINHITKNVGHINNKVLSKTVQR